MNNLRRAATVLALALLIPSAAFADLRRIDLKVMGMD